MPVDIEELLQKPRSLDEKILEFLAAESQKAFSVHEIYAGVEGISVDFAKLAEAMATMGGKANLQEYDEYRMTLATLMLRGLVKSAMHGGEHHYYFAGEGLP